MCIMYRDQDLSEITLNRKDLKPKKRLDALFERSRTTHIDQGVSVKTYFGIAGALLITAERYHKEERNEVALLTYLRYQTLIKKLRSHPRYKDIPIGDRSAFDYKLKGVSKKVKELSEKVFDEYKKFYTMCNFGMQEQDLEGYQEQRPTVSTVRTFISSPTEETHEGEEDHANRPSERIQRERSRSRNKDISLDKKTSSSVSIPPTLRSIPSNIDSLCGIRKSIFPTKQVREFDEIYGQRRIVRSHRTVIVPSRITTEFSHLSLQNTKKNLETVGYLAGKELNAHQLLVTHLILPEQVGYSDYFKVKDSSILIRYLEQNDLLTLGWIHSHPIEKGYLSSSDMHYHSVFQSVIPEAIAMVYSPKYMNSTIFNLTPTSGLKLILSCRKKGFHVHPTNPPIAMVSQHAITNLYGDLIVKDYRHCRVMDESLDKMGPHSTDMFERMLKKKGGTFNFRKSEVTFVHIDQKS